MVRTPVPVEAGTRAGRVRARPRHGRAPRERREPKGRHRLPRQRALTGGPPDAVSGTSNQSKPHVLAYASADRTWHERGVWSPCGAISSGARGCPLWLRAVDCMDAKRPARGSSSSRTWCFSAEGIIMADSGPLIERPPSLRLSKRLNRDPITMLFIMGFVVGWLLMAMFGDWVWWRDLLVGYIVGIAAVLLLSRHLDERGGGMSVVAHHRSSGRLSSCCGSRRDTAQRSPRTRQREAQAPARRLSHPPRAHR